MRALVMMSMLSIASPVAAQDTTTDTSDQQARAIFELGVEAFTARRFEEALEHFRRAYELSPRPGMLFNIASAADRLRRDDEALEAYRAYVAADPEAEHRVVAEERIRVIEGARSGEPRETPPTSSDPSPWITMSAGFALALGGAIMLGIGAGDRSTVENADGETWSELMGAYDRAPILEGVGGASVGVGLALAIVGIVWGTTAGSSVRVSLSPYGIAIRGTL